MNVLYVALAPWVVMLTVWFVAAPFSRKTVQSESLASRLSYVVPMAIASAFLYSSAVVNALPWLGMHLLPQTGAVLWGGIALDYVGIAFALWARAHLGRLWSGTITLKEGHRLVQNGPFAITRHPIYTGIVFAASGGALLIGTVRGFIAVVILACGLSLKLAREEALLSARFGDEHRDYRSRVRRLIPFVW